MAAACLISTIASRDVTQDPLSDDELAPDAYDGFDESAYLNGQYGIL